jgi:hypothetical protein
MSDREKKRERDLRYYASEKGRANRQRKLARARERWLSDPQWRFRRKLFSMRSRARIVLAQPSSKPRSAMGRMRLSIWGRLTAQRDKPLWRPPTPRRKGRRDTVSRRPGAGADRQRHQLTPARPDVRMAPRPDLEPAGSGRSQATAHLHGRREGPFGAVPPLTYVIDLKDYQGHQSLLISLTGVAVILINAIHQVRHAFAIPYETTLKRWNAQLS